MILVAAAFLVYIKIINWRIVIGAVIGLVSTAILTNLFSPLSTNTMFTIPPHYHLVMGSFLFGTVFMATEPVTGCHTNQGRWIYGIIFGALTVIIRSVNPAYPEGVMLSILFVNAFAALIDWFVIQSNVKRRAARHA
jgi:Na+-transporting NADH:ubiquinone oxidoreductase, subunit NqrB